MTCLVSHLCLIELPVEQVNALLKLTHLQFGACNIDTLTGISGSVYVLF